MKLKKRRNPSLSLVRESMRPEKAVRQDLAKQLHDHLGQNLTVLGVNLHILQNRLSDEPAISELINDSICLLDEIATYIRGLMQGLPH